jgi:hypothetical protein
MKKLSKASAVLLLLLVACSSVCRAAQMQCTVEHSLDGGSTFQRVGLLQVDDERKVCECRLQVFPCYTCLSAVQHCTGLYSSCTASNPGRLLSLHLSQQQLYNASVL